MTEEEYLECNKCLETLIQSENCIYTECEKLKEAKRIAPKNIKINHNEELFDNEDY